MADEFDPANENIKQTRFWVEHLPVNDAYVALFGDKLETASRIPLRHPEIPALGKKRNVATPLEQQYGHKRWEQLPKEQTLFSTLEEIDTTLEKSGLWRDPETNDIVSIENRPRPKDQPRAPLLLEGPSEEKTGKEPSKGRMFRGIGSLMRGRNILSLLQGLREGYELLPEEYQVLDEAWQYLKGTEFNPFDIDKPGIESFKELLGISPEDLGETILLPGPPQETEELPFSEVFLSRSTPEDMDINRGRRPPGRIVYAINNERGDNIGFVDIDSIDNGVANISDIVVSGRNSLGYRNMRQLLDQLQQKHPEIKRISGERVSGARRGGAHGFAGTGDDVSVDLSSPRGTSEILPKAAGGFIDKPLYDDQRMIG